MRSEAFNIDCMAGMADKPDKYWDLAIVDPPFKEFNQPTPTMRGFVTKMQNWSKPPERKYFDELLRVSQNQIIHGGNYFTDFLPPNNGWIIWYKNNDGVGFSMAELFWSSMGRFTKLFEYRPMGNNGFKIHPTQKPAALYRWLLTNYAKPCDTILDTHLGSGSSRIAAYDLGFDFTGYELDKDYFEAQEERFARHIAQPKLFTPEASAVQENLFDG